MRLIPPRITLNVLAVQGRGGSSSSLVLQGAALALKLAAILVCTQGGTAIAQSPIWSDSPASLSPALIAQAAAQRLIFVNPIRGDDSSADGTQRSPSRTITQALQTAQPNTILLLATGTYSANTGEQFPILLKPGVTLQGDPSTQGRGIVIQGGGTFPSSALAGQTIALVGANRAGLTGVTVNNPGGYGLWIESSSPTVIHNTFTGNAHGGIAIRGTSTPLIQGNRLSGNGTTGIAIAGDSQPEVRENVVERGDVGITIAATAAPRLIQNQIRQNRTGVLVQEDARPLLQENAIEANTEDGLVATGQSQPNLGTATTPGNNRFQNNRRYGVNATATAQTIPAFGNQEEGRSVGALDRTGTSPITRPRVAAAVASASPPASPVGPPASRPVLRPAAAITQLPPSVSTGASGQTGSAAIAPAASRQPIAPVGVTTVEPSPPRLSPPAAAGAITIQVPLAPAAVTPPVLSLSRPATVNAASALQTIRPPTELAAPPETAISTPPPIAPSRAAPQAATANPAASGRLVSIRSSSRQEMEFVSLDASSAPAIEIPVPPPESGNTPANRQPSPPPARTVTLRAELLPVPGTEVPVGNTGDMPRVSVSRTAAQNVGGLAAVGRQRSAAELKYRVVVEADDEIAETLVRSLAPGAFFIDSSDRDLMQVGAFSTRDNAEEARDLFRGKGLSADIQRIQ